MATGMLIGATLGGTFKVTRLVGQGGMGAVYEAQNIRLNKRFAVKVLSRDVLENPDVVHRFQREARICSSLGHPHITEIIDFNETEDGTSYIVMEFLDGEDLSTRLERVKKLPPSLAVPIVGQVCSALGTAHDNDIVHRDLKPANIFLCAIKDQGDFVKVLDFGISKILGSTSLHTREDLLIGTPNYMAPEQAEGHHQRVGPWTDIFALGTILYEMLSGRLAFISDSLPSLLYKVVHVHPEQLSAVVPDIPEELAAVVEKAMAKRPEDRFCSMAELASALSRAVSPDHAKSGGSAHLLDRGGAEDAKSAEMLELSHQSTVSAAKVGGPLSTMTSAASEIPGASGKKNTRHLTLAIAAAVVVAVAVGIVVLAVGPSEDAGVGPVAGAGPPDAQESAAPVGGQVAGSQPLPKVSASASGTPGDAGQGGPDAVPATVRIRFQGKPRGARVTDLSSGAVLGSIPLVLETKRSSRRVKYRVEHKGYRRRVLELSPDEDRTVEVKLKRAGRRFNPDRITNPFAK